MPNKRFTYWLFAVMVAGACSHKNETVFSLLNARHTGITFENIIRDTDSLNILDYLYLYNGGGVGIGDINNDGLPDIYFTSNQGSNKLYLNKGDLKFEDITTTAGVAGKGNWKTGVTIADVNGDGLLDIYVSAVGAYKNFTGRNQLYINNGNTTFTDKAAEYGIDTEGFNTQSVFFDYDHDGDLDMFLVNHSVHSTETYVRAAERMVTNKVSGDKLFQNNGNHFTEVTKTANIYSSIIGYGLNAVAGDLNNDGWDDLYVSNDFHENDYYYVNQQNGTFKEMGTVAFAHQSRFSMGSDIADINNDGWADIITLDMLPRDEKILKSSAADDPPDIYDYKLAYGYHHQLSRNCLQLNRGGGTMFSDIGLYAGMAATDWSWSALAADFNNDGVKDIFISNGIVRRPNDLDYLKYTSGTAMSQALQQGKKYDMNALTKMPDGKWHNYMFRSTDSLQFIDESINWGFDKPSYSNGAAYADLDNDGDLDLAVNNINEPAFIYRNNTAEQSVNNYIQIELKGFAANPFAIGAKVLLKQKDTLQMGYVSTTKGFQSSSLQYVHFGTGIHTFIDTVQVIWPDGNVQTLLHVKANQKLTISYQPGTINQYASVLPVADTLKHHQLFTEITNQINLPYRHIENDFNDFNTQAFIPHKLSTEGPKMAVADVNNDGLDDFFVCGAKGKRSYLFIQNNQGTFKSSNDLVWIADSLSEDVNALFFDADGDADKDLYVITGGNETESSPENLDRLYINDGKGTFKKSSTLPPLYGNKSVAVTADIDHDGDMDLFIGGRVVAGKYGEIPTSYLLVNNGRGVFSIADNALAPGLQKAGMITGAAFFDVDKDGWQDLILAGAWMPITIFKNNQGTFTNQTIKYGLQQTTGLWTTLSIADINNDGMEDVLLGNWGENSKLTASRQFPLKLWWGDFDNNGTVEQLLAVHKQGEYFSFLGKEDIEKQLPSVVRRKFADYASFAGKNMDEVFGSLLQKSTMLSAEGLSSMALIQSTGHSFKMVKLPASLQWSPLFSFCVNDFNGDGKADIISGGNFYGVSPFEGRYDASYVDVLVSDKTKGELQPLPSYKSGLWVKGEVRDIKVIKGKGNKRLIAVAVNNNKIHFFRINK